MKKLVLSVAVITVTLSLQGCSSIVQLFGQDVDNATSNDIMLAAEAVVSPQIPVSRKIGHIKDADVMAVQANEVIIDRVGQRCLKPRNEGGGFGFSLEKPRYLIPDTIHASFGIYACGQPDYITRDVTFIYDDGWKLDAASYESLVDVMRTFSP